MKKLFLIVFFLKISFGFSQNSFVEFNPPHLIWLDSEELNQILADQTIAGKSIKNSIIEKANQFLKANPNPTDSIYYEGLVSNHPKRIASAVHLQDMESLFYLNWTYILTKKDIYGEKAKTFLISWAKTYKPTGNDVNENKLAFCFFAFETLKSKLSVEEKKIVENWLSKIAEKQIENWNPNSGSSNRHVKRAKLILMGGMVLENKKFKDFALQKIDTLLNYAILPDGKTQDLIRRDAMHYHVDCLTVFMEVNYLTRFFDIDLYHKKSVKNASILNCMNTLQPYLKGEKVQKEWVNTTIDLDKKRWQAGDEFYKPGKPWNPADGISLMILTKKYDKNISKIFEEKYKNQMSDKDKFSDWLIGFTK